MLIGKVIADRRKEYHLSQNELAEGICTQATISKIEAKNIEPLLSILIKICKRLDLTLDQVFSEFNHESERTFEKIDNLISSYHFKEAESLLNTVEVKNLSSFQEKHFYFEKGNLALNFYKNFEDANFYFGLVLQNSSIYPEMNLLAFNGLGIIYFEQGSIDKAKFYFERALELIDNKKYQTQISTYSILKALNNITRFYSKIGELEKSNQLIYQSINYFKEHNSLSYLDQFYYRLAFNIYGQENKLTIERKNQVNEFLEKASFLAMLSDNKTVLKAIESFAKSRNLC